MHKKRSSVAPVLVWMAAPLFRLLDAGVRVLPQRKWEGREIEMYRLLDRDAVGVDRDGTLSLPLLRGETLSQILSNGDLSESLRYTAIEAAVRSLRRLHLSSATHGDAMAENVMVTVDAAHWFDFENLHDPARSVEWRCADDVRALLTSCLARMDDADLAPVTRAVFDAYGDERVERIVVAELSTIMRRPLAFHLGQAPFSYGAYRGMISAMSESHTNG